MVQTERPQMTKTTNTHSQYVTLIAFPLQQWLCESAWMLHYMYIARLVFWWIQHDSCFLLSKLP